MTMTYDAPATRTSRHRRHTHTLRDSTDSIGALAGPANVIMQLAWPQVGWGVRESVVDSGNVYLHPFKRARTTFTYLAVAILGTDADRAAYREAVNTAHRHVRSREGSPVKYNAFDPELQMWVAACLYVGFEDCNEWLYGRMTAEEREEFYRSARPLGTTLQVRDEQWPDTRAEFEQYWREGIEKIRIDPGVRRHLTGIAEARILPQPLAALSGRFARFVTIGFLHPEFREEMEFGWSPADQRRFERFLRLSAAANRCIPGPLRNGTYKLLLADLRWRIRTGRPLV